MKSRLSLLRTIFLIIFILSSLLFCYIMYLLQGIALSPGGSDSSTSDLLIIYTPLVTSAITFLGFVVTSILSFRREKREAREAVLSQKLKEVELERARLELEKLKKQVNKNKK